jgi:hypothetical protein
MHNVKGSAVKIQARLGAQIMRACAGTIVPPSFLAGLISVEDADCDPRAARFEKAVYEKLKQLRNPLVFWQRSWNGITQADLKDKSDAQLVDLATSFGYTQIMGWQSVILKRTVAEIRDASLHLMIACELLMKTASPYLVRKDFESVLRIWNTGNPNGRTYDPQYVPNAMAVMNAYQQLPPAKTNFVSPRNSNDAPRPEGTTNPKEIPAGQS